MGDGLRILLTGFEKFGGEKVNPSELILRRISKKTIGKHFIDTLILPVSYERSIKILEEYYSKNNVDLVVHLGQAGGRATINIERVAVNIMDSTHPDNDEKLNENRKIIQNGADAYMTKLDVKKIAEMLNKKKIPASVSYTAGQYICNEVYYYSLHSSSKNNNPKNVLFIHVPFLPEQVAEKYPKNSNIPSMSLQLQVRALKEILSSIPQFLVE